MRNYQLRKTNNELTLKNFIVLSLLSFESCPTCMSSANIVAEILFKLLNERVLSTAEPCTSEYVTLIQSFHRGTLIVHWYIAKNF